MNLIPICYLSPRDLNKKSNGESDAWRHAELLLSKRVAAGKN